MKVRVAFTVDQEVMDEIDNRRGLACRSAYINHVLKLGLKTLNGKPKTKGRETQCLDSKTNEPSGD